MNQFTNIFEFIIFLLGNVLEETLEWNIKGGSDE